MADLKISVDFTELTGLIKTTDQTKQAVRVLGQQFARTGDQAAYLRGINQIANAQNRLAQGSRMSRSEIMRFGAQTRQQTVFTDELTRAQHQLNAAMQGSTRGINRMGVLTQQSGYQIGDFLVQVQSGTNALVAFGQQATQMAGTLTLLGGKWLFIGSALGIAIPLLTAIGAALMRTRGAAEEAADGIQTLADRVSSARQQIADMAFEVEAMRQGFEDFREFALTQAVEEARDRVRELGQEIYDLQQLGTVTGPNERELASAQEALRLAQEQLTAYQRTREEHEGLTASMEQGQEFSENLLTAYQTLRDVMREAGDEFKQGLVDQADALAQKVASAEEEVRQAAEQSRILKEQMAEAKREAEILAAIDIKSGIEGASAAAIAMANALGIGLDAAIALSNLGDQGFGGGDAPYAGRGQGPQGPRAGTGEALAASGLVGVPSTAIPRGRRAGGGGGGGSQVQTIQEIIAARQQQIAQEIELLRLGTEQRRVREIQLDLERAYQGDLDETGRRAIAAAAERIAAEEQVRDSLQQSIDTQNQLADSIAGSFGDAFMSIVDGTATAEDAFKNMARQIISELFRVLVVQRMVASISGALGGGGAGGGILGALFGRRASGGSMMAGKPYLVGEHGPEMVIPGRSGTVRNADLTEKTMGGGGTIVVNQTINVSTGVQQTVRNEIKQLMPQIAESAKSAVVDAKRRGGAYGRSFN